MVKKTTFLFGLITAFITIGVAVNIPEIRCFLRLASDFCEEKIVEDKTTNISVNEQRTSFRGATLAPRPSFPDAEKEAELKSARGVNYTKLRSLLKQQMFKEADGETLNVMLQAVGEEEREYLSAPSADNYPCEDLQIMNQLWSKYSDGKFGFFVQAEIYKKLGGINEYNEQVWKEWGYRVGWRNSLRWLSYEEFDFTLIDTPQGHLPALATARAGVGFDWGLFSRIETCQLEDNKG